MGRIIFNEDPNHFIFTRARAGIERVTREDLVDFIIANPSILRRPIILNEDNFQIGYDKEEIETFIPRKDLEELCVCDKNCPNYETCGKLRNG